MTNTRPFITQYKSFWTNVQAMIFYPFQNIGPFIVAAMPALFTGHSVYTWYAETSTAWLAMLISCVVAVAMEAININVVHTSLDLFEQKQNGKGWLMVFFSVIVMGLVSIVIGFSEDDLSPLIKGLAVSSPWLTGIVYLAVGMAQNIHQEKQQSVLSEEDKRQQEKEDREFERKLKLAELEKKHQLKMAKIEAQKSVSKVSHEVSHDTHDETVSEVSQEKIKNEIINELNKEKPNLSQLARDLGVSRSTIYRYRDTVNGTGNGTVAINGNGTIKGA